MSYEAAGDTHTSSMLLQAELVTINQKVYAYMHIHTYSCTTSSETIYLPLSSTIFLFVNNSLHTKAKGVFRRESN
jgi:hypothetical protein